MSRNLIAIAAALSLAAVLPACQSTGGQKSKAELCQGAKTAGNKNTPTGQANIAVHCSSQELTSESFSRVWWSTHARHQKCLNQTGRICET